MSVGKVVGIFAGQNYTIYRRRKLPLSERLADDTFESIAADGEANVFLCRDDPEAGIVVAGGASKYQYLVVGGAKRSLIKDPFEITR